MPITKAWCQRWTLADEWIKKLWYIYTMEYFSAIKKNAFESVLMMEKAMATHSSTLAWKIPWMEEPGKLQSMGSRRVGHDWVPSLSLFTFMHWRRKWQPAPVFLPGESQGRGSLVGCHLWGRIELDTTEATYQHQPVLIYKHVLFSWGKSKIKNRIPERMFPLLTPSSP